MAQKKGSKSKGTAKKVVNQNPIPDKPNPSKIPEEKASKAVKSAGEKASETVKESVELLGKLSENQPKLIQSEIDQDVKDAIAILGKCQSQYQQLNVIRKSRGLRQQIRQIRQISNGFR